MIKKRKQILALVLILFIIFVIGLGFWLLFGDYLFTESREQKTDSEPEKDQDVILMESTGLNLYNDQKTQKWELKSGEITYNQKSGEYDFSPLEIQVYNLKDDSKLEYSLQGEQGTYKEKEGSLYITGNVVVKTGQTRISVGEIMWDQSSDLLKGSGGFTMEKPRFFLEGNEFESDIFWDSIKIIGGQKRANLQFEEE
ncbi:MAG: LPS export ABC transporter periplasmic protein LptC [Halanaerobiaceae bacterium]